MNDVQRQNTSDLIFPTLETGDVIIYNFTLWHAIAPIEAGTRYSFVLFYDMDNPAIQDGECKFLSSFLIDSVMQTLF